MQFLCVFPMIFEYLSQLPSLSNLSFNHTLTRLVDWAAGIAVFSDYTEFKFTEFQLHLLKLFTAILCVITCLIVYYWCKYGEVISERFIRPSKWELSEII